MVLETDGSGSLLASYVLGGTELFSQTRGEVTSYNLHDGQGSVRTLTDESGAVTDTYAYTAFGELYAQTGSTINAYLYTGQQFDQLTGLYYMRARYYLPSEGRFLSADPYNSGGFKLFAAPKTSCSAGQCGMSSCSRSVQQPCKDECDSENQGMANNRYNYTSANPINKVDPSGLFEATLNYGITINWIAIRNQAATVTLSAATACVLLQVFVSLAVVPNFVSKGKWTCTASCNIQNYKNIPCAPLRVQAQGSGPSQTAACEDAKRNAVHMALPGTYARHCQCINCHK